MQIWYRHIVISFKGEFYTLYISMFGLEMCLIQLSYHTLNVNIDIAAHKEEACIMIKPRGPIGEIELIP